MNFEQFANAIINVIEGIKNDTVLCVYQSGYITNGMSEEQKKVFFSVLCDRNILKREYFIHDESDEVVTFEDSEIEEYIQTGELYHPIKGVKLDIKPSVCYVKAK